MAIKKNEKNEVVKVMFDKWTQYSYKAQQYQRHRFLKILLICFILFIAYNCLCAFFFSVWIIENDTMMPSLCAGDRLLFSSFKMPAFGDRKDDNVYNFKRGSIVLIDMGRTTEQKIPLRVIDTIVRFFTAQRVSIFSGRGQYYIKRVIALPGDEISMSNYMFRVKTSNNRYSLTEFEVAERPYHPAAPQSHPLWDESLPFSGTMDAIVLGPNECFVVSDDRSNTNDSRTWGTIPPSMITAKAVLRFWPFNKIDLL